MSFSLEDSEFGDRLVAQLQIELGNIFVQRAQGELTPDDVFVAVLSPEYLASVESRRQLDRASRSVLVGTGRLIPVVRRSCEVGGLAGMLEPADFTDEAKFEVSLAELVLAIRGDQRAKEPGQIRPNLTAPEVAKILNDFSNSPITVPDGPEDDTEREIPSEGIARILNPARLLKKANIVSVANSARALGAQVRAFLSAGVLGPGPLLLLSPRNSEPKILISYVGADREFVTRILPCLKKEFPRHQLKDAFEITPRKHFLSILGEIDTDDIFIPVLSDAYMRSISAQRELARASLLALRGKGRVLPLLRQPCRLTGLVAMLEPADFTDDADFERAIQSLVRSIARQRSPDKMPGQFREETTVQEYAEAAVKTPTFSEIIKKAERAVR